ncbi:allantoicase [uncultured Jatrophihabitans sp.]|uniref:allantoicase n=1 Tax=uncultured Jatrophihabitans sp. TaxID=1610747 RepID=UPI0035CC8962
MTTDFRLLPDVASRALGATVLAVNDEFYADSLNLISPAPAGHDPLAYAPRGKVYDGWETRRRRGAELLAAGSAAGSADGSAGGDWVIIRLAVPAIVRGVDVDTTHFRGNYPPFASVAAATVLGYPGPEQVSAAVWTTLVERAPLTGDASNLGAVSGADTLATHVRLTIHPDGGVARLRVFGEVVPDPRRLGGRPDLAALANGGLVEDCSNMFYSSPANVLSPGVAQVMSDGWETARRRDDGNDWLIVRLAAPGVLRAAVIDTSRFVGNAPGEAALSDADTGDPLLPRTRLLADTEHRFRLAPAPAVRRVRLDVYPDGGISRLRLLGDVAADAREKVARRWTELLPDDQLAAVDAGEFYA